MSIRQPGIVLLAIGCPVVGLLLLGHGLTTPFALGQPLNQWVGRLPYLAMLLFTLCLALAATDWAKRSLAVIGEHAVPALVLAGLPTLALTATVSISLTSLHGSEPVANEEAIRTIIAYTTMALSVPVSWTYWRRFRLGLDIVHASLSIAAVMTGAAMMSMHFGQLWRLSWWDYHGCLLAGFAGVSYGIFERWSATKTAASALENAFETDPLALIASNYPTPLRDLVEAMETKDSYTHGHSARTATLAVSMPPPRTLRRRWLSRRTGGRADPTTGTDRRRRRRVGRAHDRSLVSAGLEPSTGARPHGGRSGPSPRSSRAGRLARHRIRHGHRAERPRWKCRRNRGGSVGLPRVRNGVL